MLQFPLGPAGFEKKEIVALTGLSPGRVHQLTRADNRDPIVTASVRRGEKSRVRSRSSFENVVCLVLGDRLLRMGMPPLAVRHNLHILSDSGFAEFNAPPESAPLLFVPRYKNSPILDAFVKAPEAVPEAAKNPLYDGGFVIDLRTLIEDLIDAANRYARGEAVQIGVRELEWKLDADGNLKTTNWKG